MRTYDLKRKLALLAAFTVIGGMIAAVQAALNLDPDSGSAAALGAVVAAFMSGSYLAVRSILPSAFALLKGAEKEVIDELAKDAQ